MPNRIPIIINLLILCFSVAGQINISKHFSIEEGLSNNSITDIVQDGQGFVWIATESGLNRFDGKNFTVYTKNNSDLVSNELNTLLYDKEENKIWIGSQREGISIYDCFSQSFKNYTVDEGLRTNDVTDLSHAKDGGIWITHYHLGVEYYDKKTGESTLFADREIANMKSQNWCSCDDGKGHLYIGHRYDGISIIDIKNMTARNIRHNPNDDKSLPGNEVRAIYMDSQKNIWVGTNGGLALFNPQTEEFITFKHDPSNPNSLNSDVIYNIVEMKDGNLWIGTDMSGISILNLNTITLTAPQEIKFQNIVVAKDSLMDGLSSHNIRSLFQDSFNNIWIGHYRKGIDFISNKPLFFNILPYNINNKDQSNEKQIWDIYIDKDEQLWVGTENEVAIFQDNKFKKSIDIKPYLTNSRVSVYINAIKSDKNGYIWLGTNNSDILKLAPHTYQIKNIPLDEESRYVHAFYEDIHNDKMWIATENGLFSCRNDIIDKEEHINKQLSDKTVYSILHDKQGKLWLATFGKGIFIFNQKDSLINNIVKEKGFCSNAINSLYLDSKGSIWAATRNGLACFEDTNIPEQYQIYNDAQGLESPYIWAIQEDHSGNIWISTNTGISLWDRKEKKFSNYNYQDGIPSGDFTSSSVGLNKDGIIYFGSLNGICYFNPQELTQKKQQITPVQIIECLSLNKQIETNYKEMLLPSANNKIELSYNHNSFRISFSNPDYSQSQQVEYAYMMEGLDNIWYNTHDENQVTFRNISPGEYTFKVKSRLKNQDWDEVNIATLDFVIQPPLWLTWYAKLLYVVAACVIIYFTLRSYKRKIDLKTSLELERKNSQNKQELNDERLRFYTNITHELRTPLTLILGPLEDLLHNSNLPSLYQKKINIMHENAIRLLSLINQILEFRKTETQNRKLTVSKGNLGNLVMEIGLRFKELNQNDNVTIHIDIADKNAILYFDVDMITTILNNLLSNAIKYTPAGHIRLSLHSVTQKENNYTEIVVSDTGYGIQEDALPFIFEPYYQVKSKHQSSGTGIGLALVKSLVELHEGILSVESSVDKGTTFSFRLLTRNTYPNALHVEEKISSNILEETIETENEAGKGNQPVILVIEDDKDIREYIVTSLTENYRILPAANGKEGLALAQKHIPNIIVSDIMMPEMDGLELCRRVKKDICTSHIPIILLTAKDGIHDKEEGYKTGADSYITKPFSAGLLRSRISNLLELRRKQAEQIRTFTKGTDKEKDELRTETIKISRLDEEFLNKLTMIIENNMEFEELDITFIIEKMNMSYSTFYRKIKGLTEMTPNEFIRKIRLKNSLQLLLSGSYNVSEVAYMLGFNDIAYFRKCFKEEYGMAPSEYIKARK